MFTFKQYVGSLLVLAGTAGGAIAQQPQDRPQPQDRQQPRDRQQPDRRPGEDNTREGRQRSESDDRNSDTVMLIPSTRAEGAMVTGADGARLGTVRDAIVRGHSGRVVYILVSKGITTSPQEPNRVAAVPYAAFRWNEDQKVLTLPVTQEQFRAAASFDVDQWQGIGNPAAADIAYEYFKVPKERAAEDREMHRVGKSRDRRDMRDMHDNPGNRNDQDRRDGEEPRTRDGRDRDGNDADRQPGNQNQDGRKDPRSPDGRDQDRKDPARQPGNTSEDHRWGHDGKEPDRATLEGSLFRVTEVRNQPLTTKDGRGLGTVNDVIFDANSGRIAFLVITPAASMEAGDGRIGVPWPSFQVDQSGRLMATDLHKETLKAAPRFTQNEWGELKIDGYTEDMYKRFGHDNADWGRSSGTSASRDGQWRDKYRSAMKTGETRIIRGTVESIEQGPAMGGMEQVVILNVRTEDGETIAVHTAPQAYLDQHKLAVRKGDPITLTARTFEMDGKKCVCATDVAAADGKRVVLHTEGDSK